MGILPANIVEAMIWRKFYRFPHSPFQIAAELLEPPVAEEKSAAIHRPVQPEVFAGKSKKGRRSKNVERF